MRPRRLTLAEKVAILRSDDSPWCECGWLLSVHPALPKPGPLTSWQATRGDSEAKRTMRTANTWGGFGNAARRDLRKGTPRGRAAA